MSFPATSFIFVVDGPRLETQAILLASTLRKYHPQSALIAYVSPASAVNMPKVVRRVFETCEVELRFLPEHGDTWRREYPHGNKLFALADRRDTEFSVFLDTDMVACRSMVVEDLPAAMEVSVVPEGVPSWGNKDDRWERAYAHFGLDLPTEKVRLTRRRRREFLPYFNAGFVAVREEDTVDSKSFGQLWLDTAIEFDFKASIGGKRPWLDQITLPIAMKRFGYQYKVAATENNFSISDRAYEPDADPIFLHYHRAKFLEAWPQSETVVNALMSLSSNADRADVVDRLRQMGMGVEGHR